MNSADDTFPKLTTELQLIEDVQYEGSRESRSELLETLEKLKKYSLIASTTRENVMKIERAIDRLQSQYERASDNSLNHKKRKTDDDDIWRGHSRKAIKNSDERHENYSRYLTSNDTEDEALNSSHSSECEVGRSIQKYRCDREEEQYRRDRSYKIDRSRCKFRSNIRQVSRSPYKRHTSDQYQSSSLKNRNSFKQYTPDRYRRRNDRSSSKQTTSGGYWGNCRREERALVNRYTPERYPSSYRREISSPSNRCTPDGYWNSHRQTNHNSSKRIAYDGYWSNSMQASRSASTYDTPERCFVETSKRSHDRRSQRRNSSSVDESDDHFERRSRSRRRSGHHKKRTRERHGSRHKRSKKRKSKRTYPRRSSSYEVSNRKERSTSKSRLKFRSENDCKNYSVFDTAGMNSQSTVTSTSLGNAVETAYSPATSHLYGWQNEFDSNIKPLYHSSPIRSMESRKTNTVENTIEEPQRQEIHSSNSSNNDPINTNELANVRLKLSTLIKSALADQKCNDDQHTVTESSSQVERSMGWNDHIDQSKENDISHSGKFDNSIDAQTLQDNYELASQLPFDYDSVKQAVETAKTLDSKRFPDTDARRSFGTGLVNGTSTEIVPINRSVSWYVGSALLDNHTANRDVDINSISPVSSQINQHPPADDIFREPALPPNRLNRSSSKGNQKTGIVQRRSTISTPSPICSVHSTKPQQASKTADGHFKIPKVPKTLERSTPSSSVEKPNLNGNEDTVIVIEDDGDSTEWENGNNQSTGNEIVTSAPLQKSSMDDNVIATFKEWLNSNELAKKFFELVKQITQESEQSTQTIQTRSRSLSPTGNHRHTSIESQRNTSDGLSQQRSGKRSAIGRSAFRNVDPEFHAMKKIFFCPICYNSYGSSLIVHCVNQHPDCEVVISRLPPEAAQRLRRGIISRKGVNECKIVQHPVYSRQYKQFCYFCNTQQCFIRSGWIDHISRHSGYFRFKCNHCSKCFVKKPGPGLCRDADNFEEIPQPQFQKEILIAYVCDLCNYVRFHKHEIVKHLRHEHRDDPTKYQRVQFLSFPMHMERFPVSNVIDLESSDDTGLSQSKF